MKKIIIAILMLIALTTLVLAMPNPATGNCLQQGYSWVIRADSRGNQYGVCIDKCSNECEEWALFRGECKFPSYTYWTISNNKCIKETNCMLPKLNFDTKKQCKNVLKFVRKNK